jgi:hypothetical protein
VKAPHKPRTAKSAKTAASKPISRADSVLGELIVINLGDEQDEIDQATTSV